MRRAPRSYVKYDHAHWNVTMNRFRKPMSRSTWMNSHASHAKNPSNLIPRMSATAAERPIVAMVPLSK